MPQPTLHQLTSGTDPRFAALLNIYTAAFPPEERKPVSWLRTMLHSPAYRFLLAQHREQVLGFAILFRSETTPIALLEYLAVHPDARGEGVGRWLFNQVVNVTGTTQCPLLIETESDRASTPGQAERHRRKQFYRSGGAREIDGLRYLMPQVSTSPPPAMELLIHAQPQPATVPLADLRQWLQALYAEVYGQGHADGRLLDMLGNLPPSIAVL